MLIFRKLLCCLVVAVCNCSGSETLVDEDEPIFLVPSDQQGIEFGYSLSLYKNETHRRLLVGAPLANTSQAGVASPGALYSCSLLGETDKSPCSQVAVDRRDAADKYVSFIDEDLKDFQRLGGSLSSRDNDVLVCAPNWHYYEKRVTQTIDAPVGICFKGSSLDDFQPFSLPYDLYEDEPIDYLTTGSCQAGFSSTLSKGHTPVLGAPGCYNWEGDLFAESPMGYVSYGKGFTPANLGRDEGTQEIWLSNMYLGFSLAEGEFRGQDGIAAGMPRSTHMRKEVNVLQGDESRVMNPMVTLHLVQEQKLSLWTTLTPPKNDQGYFDPVWLFSYFGYSVAAVDVDGNGLDDVIVGAPFYHNKTNFDQGAILVYMQMIDEVDDTEVYHMFFEKKVPLRTGSEDYERFGSAVSNVGDLNGDGIMDIAVGAPYIEQNGKVYIYLGGSNGLTDTPHQIFSASVHPLKERNLRGFGSAFAPSFSIEEGFQSDLAIGVPSSDTVVIFKSKILISVDWQVDFPHKMDFKSKCPIKGKDLPCVDIVTCLSYSFLERGKRGNISPREISLSHFLDVNSSPRRLFFDDYLPTRSSTITVEYQKATCVSEKVYTNREIYDLEPFDVVSTIAYPLSSEATFRTDQKTSTESVLEIFFECKSSDVSGCLADLRLYTEMIPETVQAETAEFTGFYEITNAGESSYSNKFELQLDSFLEISGKAKIDDQSTMFPTIECRRVDREKAQCALGSFINTNDTLKFSLPFATTQTFLDIDNLRNHSASFEIQSTILTLSDIQNPEDSTTKNHINLETDPQVFVTKNEASTNLISVQEGIEYKYPEEAKSESEIGPKILHIFEIYNKMPYVIERNNFRIYWPYKINEKTLLEGEVTLSIPSTSCTTSFHEGYARDDSKNLSSYGQVIWKATSCNILFLKPQVTVDVQLHLRIIFKTLFEEVYNPDFDEIRSYVHLSSTPLLLGFKRNITQINHITTKISYGTFVFHLIPLWVYILGILLGLLLLALLVFFLRKLNFFRRKDPRDFSRDNLTNAATTEEVETTLMSPPEEDDSKRGDYDNI